MKKDKCPEEVLSDLQRKSVACESDGMNKCNCKESRIKAMSDIYYSIVTDERWPKLPGRRHPEKCICQECFDVRRYDAALKLILGVA